MVPEAGIAAGAEMANGDNGSRRGEETVVVVADGGRNRGIRESSGGGSGAAEIRTGSHFLLNE